MTEMTPQHPAAPETEIDANGLTEAERTNLAVAVHDTDAAGCSCASVYAAVERIVAERVRVVEGERDDLMALAVEDTRRRGEAIARAESAEAAHEAEKAAHAAAAETWTEWGVRRTWGAVGTVAQMGRHDAETCAREWPGELVSRTVTAGEWIGGDR